jgi:hypothetical protein
MTIEIPLEQPKPPESKTPKTSPPPKAPSDGLTGGADGPTSWDYPIHAGEDPLKP